MRPLELPKEKAVIGVSSGIENTFSWNTVTSYPAQRTDRISCSFAASMKRIVRVDRFSLRTGSLTTSMPVGVRKAIEPLMPGSMPTVIFGLVVFFMVGVMLLEVFMGCACFSGIREFFSALSGRVQCVVGFCSSFQCAVGIKLVFQFSVRFSVRCVGFSVRCRDAFSALLAFAHLFSALSGLSLFFSFQCAFQCAVLAFQCAVGTRSVRCWLLLIFSVRCRD